MSNPPDLFPAKHIQARLSHLLLHSSSSYVAQINVLKFMGLWSSLLVLPFDLLLGYVIKILNSEDEQSANRGLSRWSWVIYK